jgi:hypothetical protein
MSDKSGNKASRDDQQKVPIKLEDLLPRKPVRGGARKIVFGSLDFRSTRKRFPGGR